MKTTLGGERTREPGVLEGERLSRRSTSAKADTREPGVLEGERTREPGVLEGERTREPEVSIAKVGTR